MTLCGRATVSVMKYRKSNICRKKHTQKNIDSEVMGVSVNLNIILSALVIVYN